MQKQKKDSVKFIVRIQSEPSIFSSKHVWQLQATVANTIYGRCRRYFIEKIQIY